MTFMRSAMMAAVMGMSPGCAQYGPGNRDILYKERDELQARIDAIEREYKMAPRDPKPAAIFWEAEKLRLANERLQKAEEEYRDRIAKLEEAWRESTENERALQKELESLRVEAKASMRGLSKALADNHSLIESIDSIDRELSDVTDAWFSTLSAEQQLRWRIHRDILHSEKGTLGESVQFQFGEGK